jgi:hypothetical protein
MPIHANMYGGPAVHPPRSWPRLLTRRIQPWSKIMDGGGKLEGICPGSPRMRCKILRLIVQSYGLRI